MEPRSEPLEQVLSQPWCLTLVLQALYRTSNTPDLPPLRSKHILALQLSCRALCKAVRGERLEVRYWLAGGANSGQTCAEHLSSLDGCRSLGLHVEQLPSAQLAAFLEGSGAVSRGNVRSLQFAVSGLQSLGEADLRMLMSALPGLRSAEFTCRFSDQHCSGMLGELAAGLPALERLQVLLPSFCEEHVGGLSSLTTLQALAVKDASGWGAGAGMGQPTDMLRAVAPLAGLTELHLSCRSLAPLLPAALLQSGAQYLLRLRQLSLLGGFCLTGPGLDALARGLPALEELAVSGIDPYLVVLPHVLHDTLRVISIDRDRPGWHEAAGAHAGAMPTAYLPVHQLAAIAHMFPALRSLRRVTAIAWVGELSVQPEPNQAPSVLRCCEALAVLLRRSALSVHVRMALPRRSDYQAFRTVVEQQEQLRPDLRPSLERVDELHAPGLDERELAWMAGALPRLSSVTCRADAVAALRPLHLTYVTLTSGVVGAAAELGAGCATVERVLGALREVVPPVGRALGVRLVARAMGEQELEAMMVGLRAAGLGVEHTDV